MALTVTEAPPPAAPDAAPPFPGVMPRALYRRGRAVRIAKYGLPVVALALLSSIALWPEISRTLERGRENWHVLTMVEGNGAMTQPRYRGFDAQNQPYMISAVSADRAGPEAYNLHSPRADLTLHNGTWLQVQAARGLYAQKVDQLDLSQDVTLYRGIAGECQRNEQISGHFNSPSG